MSRPAEPAPPGGWLSRFDRVERALHWTTAGLFGFLILSGAALYVPALSSLVNRRALVASLHVWCGVALLVPLLLSVVGPWGARTRDDLRRLNLWSAAERRWLRSFGRVSLPKQGKFNAGQKLNAAFTLGAMVVMLGTGSVMHWFGPFPVSWRTGATFVHDALATAVVAVVVGHIGFALTHRDALWSMLTGRIRAQWARANAPEWLEEERSAARAAPAPSAQTPAGSRSAVQPNSSTAL
ncbi:MAG TPA: cytochrome b/b6 domain-containing protein [Acidimicrobiales bacterium]|nr:cytochrome b/b6 domain-containing protein [Acidimicrobiales bacterium]